MEQYLNNPSLNTIKPDYPGNKVINNQFTNHPWPDTDASFKGVFRWYFSKNPQAKEKKIESYKLELIKDASFFDAKEDKIVWLGHSSFFIRINGVNILTDPVYTDLPFLKRKVGIPFSFDQIRNIDIILLSHAHRDHFDHKSLEAVIKKCPEAILLAPLKSSPLIRKIHKNAVIQEAGWYQTFNIITSSEITYLPALHWHRRGMNDFNEVLWGSFMIRSNHKTIYFAGDTAYGSRFTEIKKTCGSPDIALLPIGAYKPSWLMKKSHTSPEEAAQAFKDLEARKIIPMHYGTYDLANEPLGEPIKILKEIINPTDLLELKVGERFMF